MSLYLVRWPDLSCALVSADDEDHLLCVLDEVANAEGCRWTRYEGPVFLEFQLPVQIQVDWPEEADRPLTPQMIHIKDLNPLMERAGLQISVSECDTSGDMCEEIMRYAFPATATVYFDAPGERLDEAVLREALKKDLVVLSQTSWRLARTARSADEDPLAALAVEMGAHPALVEHWAQYVVAKYRDTEDDEEPTLSVVEDADDQLLSPLELLYHDTDASQHIPLRGHPDLTLRDEANAITAHVFRSGFLEELHSGYASPLLASSDLSRLSDPEMKKLMIETSAKLAHWLCLREMLLEDRPDVYLQLIRAVEFAGARGWERELQTCDLPPTSTEGACKSCQYPLHSEWRCCPMCQTPT